MIKNKTILIAGGAGFVGTHLTSRLISNDNFVIIVDNFNQYYSGKEENLKESLNGYQNLRDYEIIRGDLTDKTVLDEISNEIDFIFNLAAQAGVRYSLRNAIEVSNNNIGSAINIYNFAVNSGIKKVVFASSSSVYGNPIYTPLDEEHPKNPISPYAISKLCGEIYADYYYRELDLPVTSLRFYTVYGPRGRPDMAIRKFYDLIFRNKTIEIYGDGTQKRDFTYVSDIIDGLILAAENSKSSGEIFNLGCSNPISVNKLVDKMYSISNKEKKVKFVEKQKGDVEITYSDINKAKNILGFSPKIAIDEGLRRTYEWQINYNSSN